MRRSSCLTVVLKRMGIGENKKDKTNEIMKIDIRCMLKHQNGDGKESV